MHLGQWIVLPPEELQSLKSQVFQILERGSLRIKEFSTLYFDSHAGVQLCL